MNIHFFFSEIICDPPHIPNGVPRPELSKYRGQDRVTYECKRVLFLRFMELLQGVPEMAGHLLREVPARSIHILTFLFVKFHSLKHTTMRCNALHSRANPSICPTVYAN